MHGAFVVPLGDVVANLGVAHDFGGVSSGYVGIDKGFEERVRRKSVGSVQTCATTFASSVEAVD